MGALREGGGVESGDQVGRGVEVAKIGEVGGEGEGGKFISSQVEVQQTRGEVFVNPDVGFREDNLVSADVQLTKVCVVSSEVR